MLDGIAGGELDARMTYITFSRARTAKANGRTKEERKAVMAEWNKNLGPILSESGKPSRYTI